MSSGIVSSLVALLARAGDPHHRRSLVAAALAALFAAALAYYRHDAIGSGVRLPKSIKRAKGFLPIIGGLIPSIRNYNRALDYFLEAAASENFKTQCLPVPFAPPFIFFLDPAGVEFILKTEFDSFVKGNLFVSRMKQILGHGIFVSDGETWRVQRKTASHIFSTKKFREFFETVFASEMQELIARLRKSADGTTVVDMQDNFFRFTLDGFGQIGFGVELNTMQKDNVPFAAAFDRAQGVMDYRFFSPLWWLEELIVFPRWLQMRRDASTIRSFAADIVRERKAESAAVRDSRSDLLTLFMNVRDDNGVPLDDERLCDDVLNFIIAGRDTTAQALSWCIYYLNKEPRTMAKLVAEIDETLGEKLAPTYDQAKSMKYANAVFHEALRLSPSVPKDSKVAAKDLVFPNGNVVPAGTAIAWVPYAMARNPNIWGSNAAEFVPERWLDSRLPSQFEYPVFNAGPRVCLGKALAELEGVYVLVSLLRQFEVRVVDLASVHYANSLTMPMRGGLKCTVRERRL
nr:Protein kinase alk2 [Polyrhizophydium stewartii]